MKTELYTNKKIQNPKFTELFGLSRSGKSTLAKKLANRNIYCSFIFKQKSKLITFLRFLKFFSKRPIKTFLLFSHLNLGGIELEDLSSKEKFKIWIMRNSYLLSVLSKYELVISSNGSVLVDEFLMQSVLMILQRKASQDELKKVINMLPKSHRIIVVEEKKSVRYARFKAHRFPGGQINKEYSLIWMKNQEENYKNLKKIIASRFEKGKVIH